MELEFDIVHIVLIYYWLVGDFVDELLNDSQVESFVVVVVVAAVVEVEVVVVAAADFFLDIEEVLQLLCLIN